jgi:arginyl-tRNA--protein-N-Asp/Glu arginylyltransferase
MDKVMRYLPPPTPCHYLPDQLWRLEYRIVQELQRKEFSRLIKLGWRRFGHMLFRPRCPTCTACQPLRVIVDSFRPDRNQRRVQRANADTRLVISEPRIDEDRLDLYLRHHIHHADQKGWPVPDADHGLQHLKSIIDGPLPVSEWAYYVEEKLVAISYIDELTDGFSGIYFFHDPEFRKLSLGNWICLSLIAQAASRGLSFVYLGYYIGGCRSMEYKGSFAPNQILAEDGTWTDFRS